MKNLLFSLALMSACFTTQAQGPKIGKLPDDNFQQNFENLLKDYRQDCFNDSTKIEIHKQLPAEDLKKDPCVLFNSYQNGHLTSVCNNARHMDVAYLHQDPNNFARFMEWLEQKQSEKVVETVKKE